MAEGGSSTARERWRILRDILITKKKAKNENACNSVSVRRFSTFDLFRIDKHLGKKDDQVNGKDEGVQWLSYNYDNSRRAVSVDIAFLPSQVSLQDLQGFNNTGNVCIWPSEEVMALYCLENITQFTDLSICELGSGMTGLAGIFLAATKCPKEVILTDGNEKSVTNLNRIISRNQSSFGKTCVTGQIFTWDEHRISSDFMDRFDVIICADCLFFTEVHESLIAVLKSLLRPTGKIYMFAPERSGTLQQFCSIAMKRFHVEVTDRYLDVVWHKHEQYLSEVSGGIYNPNIHLPLCIVLKNK